MTSSWRSLSPSLVDPNRLILLLARNGWSSRGGQPGLYSRWEFEHERSSARLLIPLDRQRADYEDLFREALGELAALTAIDDDVRLSRVLDGLLATRGDEVRFRKMTTTVRGAIPWPVGEELVSSSRNALLAAAKSRVVKLPYYGNRAGRFAHRYLQSTLMGQTEISSYVVVAYTPVDEVFHEKEPKEGVPVLPSIGSYTGREITRSLVAALEATQEAVEHFQSSASLTGFDDGVRQGVSREFAEAVKGMISDAEGAEISIQWAESEPSLDTPEPTPVARDAFEFSAAIQPVLERAITRLASMTPSEHVTASGWVSVIERPKRGAPGVVRLKVLDGSEARTLRVRLTEEQFDVAAEAIKQQQVLSVSGRQEKDGASYWLYDATSLSTVEVQEQPKARKPDPDRAPGPGQNELSSPDA